MIDSDGLTSVEALLFTPTPRQVQTLENVPGFYNILGELQWNYFAGQKTVQVLIRDIKAAT
ncbi:hypothetical protein D3C87_1980730 [compost metagenome]